MQFKKGGMARIGPFGSLFHLGIRNSRVAQLQKNYWELVRGGRAGGGRGKYDDKLLIVALCFEFPLPRNGLERHSETCLYFCSTEHELFLFRGMVRNGIPRGYFYFWSTGRNSEFFLFCRRVRNEILIGYFYFLIHGTEFRLVFTSAEGFGTEFREFLFRGTAGIPSEIIICSVYSVFRGIIFLSEIPNPTWKYTGARLYQGWMWSNDFLCTKYYLEAQQGLTVYLFSWGWPHPVLFSTTGNE